MTDHLFAQLKGCIRRAEYEGQRARTLASDLKKALGAPDALNLENEHNINALVLLAEVYDYYGRFEISAQISQPGSESVNLKQPPAKGTSKTLTQSKVRLMVAHARSLYRAPHRTNVVEMLGECRNYVVRYLANDGFPCYGTRAEIAYLLGRAYRQRQRFAEALREFTEAIRLYESRAVYKVRSGAPNASQAEEFSAHKVASILALGVSWCHYTRGSLGDALYGQLVPASMILRRTKDVLRNAYASVIRASITRALGMDRATLSEAERDLTSAWAVFEHYGHGHYAAGAALESALCALAARETKRARKYCDRLKEVAEANDFRWKRSALIVESRILRHEGQLTEAFRVANKAYELAKEQDELLGQIDGLIARSEARSHDLSAAMNDLRTVLDLNGSPNVLNPQFNPKVHAVAHLHLAKYFLGAGKQSEAMASFAEWQKVRDRVEHGSVHSFAEHVAVRLDGIKRIEFGSGEGIQFRANDGLDYYVNDARLREFLWRQAKKQGRTQAARRTLLNISNGQFYDWKREFDHGRGGFQKT